MITTPPKDWKDKEAWNRYFDAQLFAGRTPSYPDFVILRFLSFSQKKGGRIWFPGCGLDPYPRAYAERGCNVVATDFSSVAVSYQTRLAGAFLAEKESANFQGTFGVAEQDFTQKPADGKFDVIINCRAFQGLVESAMRAAAERYFAAVWPGGACIVDTINVQGHHRNVIEDSLIAAGFYIPFQKSERWYRQQLDATGVIYGLVLERPHIPEANQYPREEFAKLAERDQQILNSFRLEYERRREEESAEVTTIVNHPATVVAHIVYATG